MTKEDLADYLENIIKPEVEKFAKEKNMTTEELLAEVIKENELLKQRNQKKQQKR